VGTVENPNRDQPPRVMPRNEESRHSEPKVAEHAVITVINRDDVAPIPLPNGSWSRMVLTQETASGIASSLGYSVFTPGTVTGMVAHEVEEVAYVLAGRGELRTDGDPVTFAAGQALHIPPRLWHAVANTGDEDMVMIFGFPYPDYPPTERR
jgi:quercetin dioxygenase-like cupin family protein